MIIYAFKYNDFLCYIEYYWVFYIESSINLICLWAAYAKSFIRSINESRISSQPQSTWSIKSDFLCDNLNTAFFIWASIVYDEINIKVAYELCRFRNISFSSILIKEFSEAIASVDILKKHYGVIGLKRLIC